MGKIISLKRNYEFKKVFNKGKSIVDRLVVVYFIKTTFDENRLGIVVNKKIGNAVVRNRVKRRIKECYRNYEERIKKGYNIVIVSRVKASEASYKDINIALGKALKKSGIYIDKGMLESNINEKDN